MFTRAHANCTHATLYCMLRPIRISTKKVISIVVWISQNKDASKNRRDLVSILVPLTSSDFPKIYHLCTVYAY